MEIIFKEKYLSISAFDDIVLPEFTVITGVNGSGKSHFLTALEEGKIGIKDFDDPLIARFTSESFKLESEQIINQMVLHQQKEQVYAFIQGHYPFRLETQGITSQGLDAWKKSNVSLNEFAGVEGPWKNHFIAYRNNLLSQLESSYQHDPNAGSAFRLALNLNRPILSFSKQEIFDELEINVASYRKNLLPNHLSKVYLSYYLKFNLNNFNQYKNGQDGKGRPVLSEQEFQEKYGPKPWEVINHILSMIPDLKYRTTDPTAIDPHQDFQLKLYDVDDPSIEVDFSELSSGESTLMALVAAVFSFSINERLPDVVLLDEVDASLHPSMMRNMLSVIEQVFLKNNVRVVLVTHSPTTIALAPEDSVYIMKKRENPRLSKTSKSEALQILTDGFATLDEGIRFFDELEGSKVSIFTEGHNAELIEAALAHANLDGVTVVRGLESITSESQLKTLFEFFTRLPHKNEIMFVWDCDCDKYRRLTRNNKTTPYVIEFNPNNSFCKRGIENAFPDSLFDGMKVTIKKASQQVREEFDPDCKRQFKDLIISRSNPTDFVHFQGFIEAVSFLLEQK